MAIDLRKFIGDDNVARSGGFAGAVFLTFTLNLTFYEQMIAPLLEQAGCANVLILADPEGYGEALQMGIKKIHGAGLRYVCAPVPRIGQGVQHAKLLLMAGPKSGRMLIGSGNLTMPGYGRNLELFSQFEYNAESEPSVAYPFVQAWGLVERLSAKSDLPKSARDQISTLREKVPWLSNSIDHPDDFRIWHNFDQPVLDQLKSWRVEKGLNGIPIQEINVISPYYDQDFETVGHLARTYSPERIHIYVDPKLTTLDGSKAQSHWTTRESVLAGFRIEQGFDSKQVRKVHAKAIIGKELTGAWCVSGSANLTRRALSRTWVDQGNLELVTCEWSPEHDAFDYLFSDPLVSVNPISLTEVRTTESENSEQSGHVDDALRLSDLTLSGEILEGRVSGRKYEASTTGKLTFLRNGFDLPVSMEADNKFRVKLHFGLDTAEAARLELDNRLTPYHWIDQPEELARYGSRTYHARIQGKIETMLGAESIVHELFEFLWNRTVYSSESTREKDNTLKLRRATSKRTEVDSEMSLPPDPEKFVTEEELVATLKHEIGTQDQYDRSMASLRHLLSMALLRLGTNTRESSENDDDARDEEEAPESQVRKVAQQTEIIERLRKFLVSYCRRYSEQLINPDFVDSVSPRLAFQNHFTLTRVLLEFAAISDSTDAQASLANSFWHIWFPIVWPGDVKLGTLSLVSLLEHRFPRDEIITAWHEEGMATISCVALVEFLGFPPDWKEGLRNEERVSEFLKAKEWIHRLKTYFGEEALLIDPTYLEESLGLRYTDAVPETPIALDDSIAEKYIEVITKLEQYLPPAEERLMPIIQIGKLIRDGLENSVEYGTLVEQAHQRHLTDVLNSFLQNPTVILSANKDEPNCPRCGAQLTVVAERQLVDGDLVLCTSSRDAWIYLRPSDLQ